VLETRQGGAVATRRFGLASSRSQGRLPGMLVLSRKVGESIVIDGRIRVKVVSVEGKEIRLGVEAPPEVTVRREDAAAAAAKETSTENGRRAPS
jgi:carbon storage regulator